MAPWILLYNARMNPFPEHAALPTPADPASEAALETELAIIGMSGRFPGAGSIGELWRNLLEGKESISFFSQEELEAAGVSATLRRRADYVPARGVLSGIEDFDP